MDPYDEKYKVGDLVILRQSVEWFGVTAIEGEICMIIQIFDLTIEENFFNFRIILADGYAIDVWQGEVEKLKK